MQLTTVHTVSDLRLLVAGWRRDGQRIALVPTMGALHEGHLSLIRLAQEKADKVIVSIFVNPTQFGPHEDYHRYPRPIEQDRLLLTDNKVDALFHPTAAEMYPEGFSTNVHVKRLSEGLCGDFRPGHFDGVATIVSKLLLQALPDIAVFGEKDYQQLQVISRMVVDLNIPTEIIPAPIMREKDGLAMSSRNRYLSADNRVKAAQMYAVLQKTAAAIKSGELVDTALATGIEALKEAGFTKVDYLELRAAEGLRTLHKPTIPARLLAAAYIGTTRLIDNLAIAGPA